MIDLGDTADTADARRRRTLGNMSHELRSPLNVIIGYTATMLMGLPGTLNPEQARQLTMVQDAADRLLTAVNALIELAVLESSTLGQDRGPVRCSEVAGEVAMLLAPLAEEKGLHLAVQVDENVSDLVVTDRSALHRILSNLTHNAVRFTDEGAVTILVGDARERPGWIELAVEDTGCGIAGADQSNLFVPFERLGAGGSAPEVGAGLGLHIAKSLTNAIGGHIRIRSEPGRGSCFSVQVPRGSADEHLAPPTPLDRSELTMRLTPSTPLAPDPTVVG